MAKQILLEGEGLLVPGKEAVGQSGHHVNVPQLTPSQGRA